jgi:predicted amidohydrolase YtcJ
MTEGIAMTADLIITNGRVLTMDPGHPRAEAVAIRAGRILAVGTRAEVEALRSPATRVFDAGGRTVMPGINESHIHIFGGSAELAQLSLFGVQGFDRMAAAIRAYAAANPDLPIVICNTADYTILGDDRSLDRHILDAVMADRPLALMSPDHHTVWANTVALDKAGILHGADLPPGNEIVMGADGLAQGELREHYAFDAVIELNATGGRDRLGLSTGDEPPGGTTAEERAYDMGLLRQGLAHLARHGITSFQNMDGNRYTLELLAALEAEGDLTVRGRIPLHYVSGEVTAQMDKAASMARDFRSEFLTSGTVKFFMDGVLDSHTAVMAEDYEDRPGWRGEPRFDAATFATLCTEADKRGLQIAVHSIGDGSTQMVLDAYAAARAANGPRDSRHRIEHLEVVREADFERIKGLGVIASMQPPHPPGQCGLPLEPTISRIGKTNWPRAYAWRRMLDTDIPLILSSDWPVSSVNPWQSIHSALTRKPWADGLPDNRLSLHEALTAYTVTAARAEFAEDWKGQLKPGFAGDVIILDRDLEAAAADEVADVMPVLTICAGRVTHEG